MKFLVFSAVLCALVATGTAQTKSPNIFKIQKALGDLLSLVKDVGLANNVIISDIDVQSGIEAANVALTGIKNQYPMFGSTYTTVLPLATRTKLNTAFTNFKNAVATWEQTLDEYPLSPGNLNSRFATLQSQFLNLGAVVVPL